MLAFLLLLTVALLYRRSRDGTVIPNLTIYSTCYVVKLLVAELLLLLDFFCFHNCNVLNVNNIIYI